jgi:hypothetical protein
LRAVVLCLGTFSAGHVDAQSFDDQTAALLQRLEAAEARIRELESREATADKLGEASHKATAPDWKVGYERGFYIRPADEDKHPFELRVNGRMQFRHTGFVREVTAWRDNAGVVRPVTNRNDFEIERGRLEFRGFFLDPALQFFINLDSDTDDGHVVIFHDFWVNYEFSEAFDLYFGKAFVPGSRDWLNGALRTRFADRSLATTFFRPDRSVGVWAIGEPAEKLYYRVMIGNGFNTTDLTPDQIDTNFVYSGSMWTDLGDYGQGYSDLEWHCEPAAQIGHSFTFATGHGRDAVGAPLAEEAFVRLSDGTRLTQIGALAPGVQVDHFDIYLYSIDAAFKYRGFSANGEYFFRWLQDIRGSGPLPRNRMFDHGFYLEGGWFLIPRKLELNGRLSQIFGAYGDAQEYAGGINWFLNGTHNWKVTFDVTRVIQTPANNSGTNHRVGDTGVMFRTQLQAAF